MKVLIIYKSNTGHTKEYAKMLSNEIAGKFIPLNEIGKVEVDSYDLLIFGGWVRGGKIVGLPSFLKHIKKAGSKKIIIFAVGANGSTEENLKDLITKNIDANNVKYPLFYLQGGFDPEKLKFPLSTMLSKVAKSLKKKQETKPETMTKEDKEFLAFFQSSHNDVSKENLEGILTYIRVQEP